MFVSLLSKTVTLPGADRRDIRVSTIKRTGGWRVALFATALVSLMALWVGSASAQCLTPAGDITGDGDADIVDIQCAIILTLWEQAGGVAAYPGCVKVDPNHTDANCDGPVNVADVLLMVNYAVGAPLDPAIDADGDNCPDSCEIVGNSLTIPAFASGKSSNANYTLTPLAGGYQSRGSSEGGDLVVKPKTLPSGQ